MDRYHSIVGPMVSYHRKPLKNHCYQWFWWPKTIEKPLLAMVFGPKSIGKPLLPMVLETKNHRKTIDINGDLQSIEWSFFVALGQVSLSKDCLPLGICWTNHVFLFFGLFCEPAHICEGWWTRWIVCIRRIGWIRFKEGKSFTEKYENTRDRLVVDGPDN